MHSSEGEDTVPGHILWDADNLQVDKLIFWEGATTPDSSHGTRRMLLQQQLAVAQC